MSTDPYDQAIDDEFDRITNPHRHPGGRTMTRPDTPRTSRDQATLLLGCSGSLLLIALGVAAVIVAWRW